VARDSIANGDAGVVCHVFQALHSMLQDPDKVKAARRLVEMVEVGWVALDAQAVEAFGETHFAVFSAGTSLLYSFAASMTPRPPGLTGALTTVLRVGLRMKPPHGSTAAILWLACIGQGLLYIRPVNDSPLRAAVCEAGVVELLVDAFVTSDTKPAEFLLVLEDLCGPIAAAPDDCTRRVFTAGGMGAAVAAIKLWGKNEDSAFLGITLLKRLLRALQNTSVKDVFVSELLKHEDEIFDALLCGLAGPALAKLLWAVACIGTLASFTHTPAVGRCATRRADRAVDAVIATLRKMLPECAASAELACSCAFTLEGFAGGCSGDDAAAPGTRALCAGALPLLESMLPAVEAELAAGGLDKERRKQHAMVAGYVRTLRALAARREAAAAALIAEEEAEQAQRSKAAQAGKGKSSKTSKSKAKQPQMQQATAALAAVSLAGAGTAPAEPPPVLQPTPPQPVPPPPAPPVLPPPVPLPVLPLPQPGHMAAAAVLQPGRPTAAELVAVVRHGLEGGNPELVTAALKQFLSTLAQVARQDAESKSKYLIEALDAGAVATVVKAVIAFGATHLDVFSAGCNMLCHFALCTCP
jgi:hypothetical protein